MGGQIMRQKSIDSEFFRKKTLPNNLQKLFHEQQMANSQVFEDHDHERAVEVYFSFYSIKVAEKIQ